MLTRLIRRARVLAHRLGPRLAFFSLLSLFTVLPLADRAGEMNQFRDAQVLGLYEYAAVESVVEYGQLPLWNPYYCGGIYGLGTPQSRYASPTLLVSLLFGADAGQVITAFLMLILGMEGFFRYARTRTASAFGPMLAAPIFALNGIFGAAFFMGWINFFGFLLLPWVLHGVDRTVQGRAVGVAITAGAFAFIVGFGGTYAGPLAAIMAAIQACRSLAESRPRGPRLRRALFWTVLALPLAFGLSSFRLWPVFETLASAPRIMAGAPENGIGTIGQMLFERTAPMLGNVGKSGLFYLGFAPIPMILYGAFSRKGAVVATLVLAAVWTATGYAYATSPFIWLRELPLFETLRYPERFLLVAVLYACELLAFSGDKIVLAARMKRIDRLLLLVATALCATAWVFLILNFHGTVSAMWLGPRPPEVERDFQQARGNRWMASYFPPLSRGSLSCWEAYPVPMSPLLRGDLAAEEYLRETGRGTVRRIGWSPNRIDLHVRAEGPVRLLVNQNWHQGWRSSEGEVVSNDGLLAVDLPGGERDVTLRFLPKSGIGGGLIALGSLIGIALLIAFERRWRTTRFGGARLALLGLGPPALLCLTTLVGIREPSPPEPVWRNANGEPAFIDGLPFGARPADVRFAVPVRLAGVRLPQDADPLGIADFDLFWRVEGDVPRSVGVFAYAVGPGGRMARADHEVLAASVFFKHAPRDRLIRDAFSIYLGPRVPGIWRLYAGLWNASGDREAIGIEDAGGLRVDGGQIYLGSFTVR